MDIKISKIDRKKFIDVVFDRSKSFTDNIINFAELLNFPLSPDNSLDYKEGSEKCQMAGLNLNDFIEIGYFNFSLNRSVRVISTPDKRNDTIILSFNLGGSKNQSPKKEEVITEGVSNSILIHSTRIKTINPISKSKNLHFLKICYKKDLLRTLFGMSDFLIREIVNKEEPEIIYADLNEKIINALRSMELHKIPRIAKNPFLIGKSYELMALVIDEIENRNNIKSFRFNAAEVERLLRVRNYLTRDWGNPPTTQQVSKYLGMSPTRAKILFKQFFGKPIYTYFQEKRMAEALKLINKGNHTITEIGHVLGYKNIGHFAGSFKKQYGILPKRLSKSTKRETSAIQSKN